MRRRAHDAVAPSFPSGSSSSSSSSSPAGFSPHAHETQHLHARKANTTTAATEMPAVAPSPRVAAMALAAPAAPEAGVAAVMAVLNVVLSWAATEARLRPATALAAPEPATM